MSDTDTSTSTEPGDEDSKHSSEEPSTPTSSATITTTKGKHKKAKSKGKKGKKGKKKDKDKIKKKEGGGQEGVTTPKQRSATSILHRGEDAGSDGGGGRDSPIVPVLSSSPSTSAAPLPQPATMMNSDWMVQKVKALLAPSKETRLRRTTAAPTPSRTPLPEVAEAQAQREKEKEEEELPSEEELQKIAEMFKEEQHRAAFAQAIREELAKRVSKQLLVLFTFPLILFISYLYQIGTRRCK